MPAKKAAKKAAKKSAKMSKGKALDSVKPLTEAVTFSYGKMQTSYLPQK